MSDYLICEFEGCGREFVNRRQFLSHSRTHQVWVHGCGKSFNANSGSSIRKHKDECHVLDTPKNLFVDLGLNAPHFKFVHAAFQSVGIDWKAAGSIELVINLSGEQQAMVGSAVGNYLVKFQQPWTSFWNYVNEIRLERGIVPSAVPVAPVSLFSFIPL